MSPETVDTALGPVELVRAGSGPPVLMIHGTVMRRGTHLCLWVHPEAASVQAGAVELPRSG